MTIIGKMSGKPLHHDFCWHCIHYELTDFKQKGSRKPRQLGTCSIKGFYPIPDEWQICELYSQKGCNCEICTQNAEPILDK